MEKTKIIKLKWECAGTLDNLKNDVISEKKGVYMFIYENGTAPKRIIYVGTTKCKFNERILEHKNLFNNQKRTMWFIEDNQDVYKLMRKENIKTISNDYLDMPDIRENIFVPDVSNFANWKEPESINYFNKISVWIAEVPTYYNDKLVESKIQKCIRENFNIGYYKENTNSQFSWIGKQEITNITELNSINLKFKTLPQVDHETLIVLLNNFVL